MHKMRGLSPFATKNERLIAEKKKEDECKNVTFYTSFDEFLNHDMDAVVLANYATEHAKYAPKFKVSEQAAEYGHGSSDFFTMYNFTEKYWETRMPI